MPSEPLWARSDLKQPGTLLLAIAGLLTVAVLMTAFSCNVHEIAHAVVATVLGWEVERVDLCLPAGGGVVYAHVGAWAYNLQGYAGGLVAASVLAGIYHFAIARGEKPLCGPVWWFAGLGLVLPIGPQVVVGVLEGAVGPGEDYIQVYGAALPPLTVIAAVAGAALYTYRWRAVWTAHPARGDVASRPGPPPDTAP